MRKCWLLPKKNCFIPKGDAAARNTIKSRISISKIIGADAVGMRLTPEVIVANKIASNSRFCFK
jgi:hypothetical protein